MFKKLISVLLVFAMLVAGATISSFAAGTVISVETPDTFPKKGEEFTVTVNISGNTGFSAAQFTLGFDKSDLDCEAANTGTTLSGCLSATNPDAKDGAIIAAASTSTISKNGALATFKFKALDDITSWDFELKDLIIADSSGADLTYTVTGVKLNTESSKDTEKQETESQETKTEETQSESKTDSQTTDQTKASDKADETSTDTSKNEDSKTSDSNTSETKTDSTADTNKTDSEKTDNQETQTGITYTFKDTKGHWSESYVSKAVEYGLFKGNDDGTFGPNNNITRAQFVTVLYRKAGSPKVSTSVPFTDTKNQISEFQDAIAWAYANGYVSGKSATTFDPSGSITRQEAMKILFGYSGGQSGMETMYTSIYDGGFKDAKSIADWAKPAVYWAYYNELISGVGDNTIAPTNTATRAQIAKILVEYIDKFEQ